MIKKLFGLLASKELLLWLLGGWIFFYVTYALFSKEAFGFFMGSLSEKIYFQAPFALLLAGFFLRTGHKGFLLFREKKFRFALWLPFALGAVLFAAGFFLSAVFRVEEKRLVGEGETYEVPWKPGLSYQVSKINSGIKDETFISGEEDGGIFSYEPKVLLTSDVDHEVGVFPARRIDGIYYHTLQFGIAPGIAVWHNDELVEEGYLALRLLPPGATDEFRLSSMPHVFAVSLAPFKTAKKGQSEVEFFSFEEPSFHISARKGDLPVPVEGSGRRFAFDSEYTLEFRENTFWAWLEVVQDPGYRPRVAGLFLLLLGLPLRIVLLLVGLKRS